MVSLNLDFSHFIKHLKYRISRKEFAIGPRGNYLSQFKGEGIDFYGFRPYTFEDDASNIDWTASARTDELLVREFVQEKSLHFMVMLDTSSSMFFTSHEKLKCEFAAEVAAAISFSVAYTGNNVGLCIFNNGVQKIVDSSRGMGQYHRITSLLHDEQYYGGDKHYNSSFSYLVNAFKKHAVVFVISDFFDFGQENEDFIRSLTGKFEVIGIMVRDIAEREMPKVGKVCIEDPKTGEQLLVDSSQLAEEYYEEASKQEEEIKDMFLRNNLFFHRVYTDEDIGEALTRIYAVRGG